MTRWAKISERIGQDGRVCELAEQDPMAALLFTWSFVAADVYGILPGDPREYLARVAPALRIDIELAEAAIKAQENAGLIECYEGEDGRRLIYLPRYHRYQDVRWSRVGRPEQALPQSWTTPGPLLEWLRSDKCDKCPEDYGLTVTETGHICVKRGNSRQLRDHSGSSPGPLPDHSRLDTDTDKDTEYSVAASSTGSTVHRARAREDQPDAMNDLNGCRDNKISNDFNDDDNVRAEFMQTFQDLWPTGVPDDVRSKLLRELNATDADIALFAARKTVSAFEDRRFDSPYDRNDAVWKYCVSVMRGEQEKRAGGNRDPARVHAERRRAEWAAQIDAQFAAEEAAQ